MAAGSGSGRRARWLTAVLPARPSVRLRRLRGVLPTILQLATVVALAYAIAHFGLGHQNPALACTVALSSLGLTRDARPFRVAETAIAMVLGITLSATIVITLGRGAPQVLLTLFLVLCLATLVSRNPAFAISAGTQSMLVAVLADPAGGPYMRAMDGLIGGTVALIATAVWPRAPLGRALRAGDAALHAFATTVRGLEQALRTGDAGAARRTLAELRQVSAAMDAWQTSLESARAISRFSPLSRGEIDSWSTRARIHLGVSAAASESRLVARRAAVILRTGRPQPLTAGAVGAVAIAVDALRGLHTRPTTAAPDATIATAVAAIGELTNDPTVDQGIVTILRPVVVDLLVASGAPDDDARGSLPTAPIPTITSPIRLVRFPQTPEDRTP